MMIYIVVVLLILYVYLTTLNKEGFAVIQTENTLLTKVYRNENIYDNFYTFVYDDVVLTIPYSVELVRMIQPYLYTYGETLCIGSKTGHLVQLLSSNTKTTGLESSKSMVQMSQYKYPKNKFVHGSYEDVSLFSSNKFNHIIVPQFTLHTISNVRYLYSILKEWMIHGGYLFVCFTDIRHFPVSKLVNHTPSSYFKTNYEYIVELKNNLLTETLKDRSHERTNIQQLYPYTEQQLVYDAKAEGFKHVKTLKYASIPMSVCVLQYK